MSESMITRCPKCSTTFRVTQEVLNMAKGKVRCGQCFHIFAAEPDTLAPTPTKSPAKPTAKGSPSVKPKPASSPSKASSTPKSTATTPSENALDDDEFVNPDWLNTLFDEDDLEPYSPASVKPEPAKTKQRPAQPTPQAKPSATQKKAAKSQQNEELAPWEMELAQIEDQFSAGAENKEPIFSEQLTAKANPKTAPVSPKPQPAPSIEQAPEQEPDYMQALHSLAQDISKQDTLSANEYASQESVKQLAAEYSLATLTGPTQAPKPKSKFKWLWSIGTLVALIVLALQIGIGYFEQGSRSPEFRAFYKVACSYLSCTLPTFEDISAIEIEHVRIQSHPTLANTLQVNAIMTNTSRYAQPMPKLALEFYDLNGKPVAARLFAPKDYLHRDFLDITYMPPNTPIHIVIPIQDPGARAVTHQIKVFASNTRSY